MLRAPDVAVGNVPRAAGWVKGVPPLAVEFADTGQDEADLQLKIGDFLTHGTRYVWVVRLVGPRRVEVYEPERPMRVVSSGQDLTAPGILQNPVPVDALYDDETARAVTLRNLLNRHGYADLDAVLVEGRVEGRAQAILDVLAARGIAVPEEVRRRVLACTEPAALDRWLTRAAVATGSAAEVIDQR
jgi:hypothetical protein